MATLSTDRILQVRAEYMRGRSRGRKSTVRLKDGITDDLTALDSALDSIALRSGLPRDEQDDMIALLVAERSKGVR